MSGLRLTGLYVPGDRPERFEKALHSGADLIVLDLEDAVAPDRKVAARSAVRAFLSDLVPRPGQATIQVRIGVDDDLRALTETVAPLEIRVPKASSPRLDHVAEMMPGIPLTALIEDAAGVLDAREIAMHPAVDAIALGEADLASAVGPGPAVIESARLALVYAASATRLQPPMLSAWTRIYDLVGLEVDTRSGAALGFVGRMAVHPSQLPVIRRAFAPSSTEIQRAEAVLAAVSSGGVTRLPDGAMVDAAMRSGAERILALAAATAR